MASIPNYVNEGSTMTQKIFLGLLVISKKIFSPCLVFLFPPKRYKNRLIGKNGKKMLILIFGG